MFSYIIPISCFYFVLFDEFILETLCASAGSQDSSHTDNRISLWIVRSLTSIIFLKKTNYFPERQKPVVSPHRDVDQ